MKHLYFVRHGESELNHQRRYSGRIDTPLTEHGEVQAREAAKQISVDSIDLIVSSPLRRAHRTAEIIAETIGYPTENILVNDLFVERSLGSIQGKSWDEYNEDETLYPDMETLAELFERAKAGLAYLQSLRADTILLVGHGSYSRELRTAIDPSHKYAEPENAQVVQLI